MEDDVEEVAPVTPQIPSPSGLADDIQIVAVEEETKNNVGDEINEISNKQNFELLDLNDLDGN